jgi:peptidylprolyl isomerase
MSTETGLAQPGDTVRVHFTGKLQDGTVFDSSHTRQPMEFEVGAGKTIPGIEDAVVGMQIGESKEAAVAPEKAFGPFRNDLVHTVDRSNFPADADLAVGQMFNASGFGRDNLVVTIVDITGTNITIDANHPLAGKDLILEIQLVEIV